jgi:alcohol dehydrogenase, propanol-preferring
MAREHPRSASEKAVIARATGIADTAIQMSTSVSACLRAYAPGRPLVLEARDIPVPLAGQVLLRMRACGVCRTDLHLIDGELPDARWPIIPGHEIVGEVVTCGEGVHMTVGTRVGVPWLGSTCGKCGYCMVGTENLCDSPRFTGCNVDGGYAEHVVAHARYCFELPDTFDDVHAAPLLCAGLIGYRSWRMAGLAHRLGIYGFGAAGHIVAQLAYAEGQRVYAFTRHGDLAAQEFATQCGAWWSGDSDASPPAVLDAAIIFAPAGELIPQALTALRKGGTLICGGIHMSDIPQFPYSLLWGERSIRSVANLTRADGHQFLALAARLPLKIRTEEFALANANEALARLRAGTLSGAAVLVP